MDNNELKAAEERKRDRAYDPALRWRHIQETITWAEAQLPPEKRRNRPRIHLSQTRSADTDVVARRI
jgi:hypothetical protein